MKVTDWGIVNIVEIIFFKFQYDLVKHDLIILGVFHCLLDGNGPFVVLLLQNDVYLFKNIYYFSTDILQ